MAVTINIEIEIDISKFRKLERAQSHVLGAAAIAIAMCHPSRHPLTGSEQPILVELPGYRIELPVYEEAK